VASCFVARVNSSDALATAVRRSVVFVTISATPSTVASTIDMSNGNFHCSDIRRDTDLTPLLGEKRWSRDTS
jgi:hypothetical protein